MMPQRSNNFAVYFMAAILLALLAINRIGLGEVEAAKSRSTSNNITDRRQTSSDEVNQNTHDHRHFEKELVFGENGAREYHSLSNEEKARRLR